MTLPFRDILQCKLKLIKILVHGSIAIGKYCCEKLELRKAWKASGRCPPDFAQDDTELLRMTPNCSGLHHLYHHMILSSSFAAIHCSGKDADRQIEW